MPDSTIIPADVNLVNTITDPDRDVTVRLFAAELLRNWIDDVMTFQDTTKKNLS